MSLAVELLDPTEDQTLTYCWEIFDRAIEPELSDDRLAHGVGSICAVAFEADRTPVGFCMGTPNQAKGIVDLDLVMVPGSESAGMQLWELARAAAAGVKAQLWARPLTDAHSQLAASLALVESRVLHQLRADLPLSAAIGEIQTAGFEPGEHDEAWLAVNNAAFAGHPDQGAWSTADLKARMAEPWFDANGLRLYFDGEDLAGFCWTKIHTREGLNPLGEIYVIALAPTHHGRGLGGAMTNAGLDWLYSQGITTAMLYVEASNEVAVATYQRLGFEVFATYKAWATPDQGTSP